VRFRRWLLGCWAAVLLVAVTAAAGPSAAPAATGGMSAEQLTTMFQEYGDTSGTWLGADRTASVQLADGRTLWLFSDTFLGRPGAGRDRPRSAPLIHNSAILQTGEALGPTVTGGSPSRPASLVPAESDDEFYWVGDASVRDGSVQVLVNRQKRTGEGPLDHALTGTALATFDLPGLTPEGLIALPVGERVSWGSEVLTAGGHTYVYGTEADGQMKFAHVARMAGTDLSQPWEFWDGKAWSTKAAASARVLSGVGTSYGVRRVDDEYVLVTHENNVLFGADFVAYTADSPTGPFTGPQYLFRAPEADAGHIVYDADLHQDLARPGRLLVSYNVNSLDEAVAYSDASIYRPRFFEVSWPRSPGRNRPAPPVLTAIAQGAGNAELTWTAPEGGGDDLTYQVYRRDVTGGQTHFARLPGAGPGPARSFQSAFLTNGHDYEFAVSAVTKRGESDLSNTATMTATVPPPPPPADLRVKADTTGKVTLHWAEVPYVQLFKVLYRDLTDEQPEFTEAGSYPGQSATVGPLRHAHEYEFAVVAVGGGGDSLPTAGVRATITVAPPPAPAAPVAEQRPDGSIQLTWPQVAPGLSYLVRQRDRTAGQSGWGQPGVATGTTFRSQKLEHGHEYEFTVAAVNDGGEGPQSPSIRAVARLQPPGAAPTDLTAEPAAGSVKLSWKSSGTWHWIFRRDLTAGDREFTRDDVPAEGKKATVANLLDGHEYEFRVAVFNPGGVGPQSAPVKVRLADGLPADLKVAGTGSGTARLTWRETRPGLLYQVQLRDVTAGEAWRTDPYPVQGNRYDAVLLAGGHRYEFRVVVPGGAATAAVGLTVP
jgi:hypothetical protein